MSEIILICGYRRSGKDVLCNRIMQNNNYNYYVYSNDKQIVLSNNYIRVGLADSLKQEVNNLYSIDVTDSNKDNTIVINNKLVSPRDLYIEHARKMKEIDIDYWCKKALSQYINTDKRIIVTDFRLLDEYQYITNNFSNVVTMRIFTSSVPIPDKNINTEHNLNNFTTDYLVLRENEFNNTVKLFPQYNNYKLIDII